MTVFWRIFFKKPMDIEIHYSSKIFSPFKTATFNTDCNFLAAWVQKF